MNIKQKNNIIRQAARGLARNYQGVLNRYSYAFYIRLLRKMDRI